MLSFETSVDPLVIVDARSRAGARHMLFEGVRTRCGGQKGDRGPERRDERSIRSECHPQLLDRRCPGSASLSLGLAPPRGEAHDTIDEMLRARPSGGAVGTEEPAASARTREGLVQRTRRALPPPLRGAPEARGANARTARLQPGSRPESRSAADDHHRVSGRPPPRASAELDLASRCSQPKCRMRCSLRPLVAAERLFEHASKTLQEPEGGDTRNAEMYLEAASDARRIGHDTEKRDAGGSRQAARTRRRRYPRRRRCACRPTRQQGITFAALGDDRRRADVPSQQPSRGARMHNAARGAYGSWTNLTHELLLLPSWRLPASTVSRAATGDRF